MYTILITGGTGCIGSVTIYKLLQFPEVEKIVVASRSNRTTALELWLGPRLDERLEFIDLDVSDYGEVHRVVLRVNPTHIVHLGAYQSPDCSRFHFRGMEINTGGTMALFDAAEALKRLERFVFASSAAVYGKRSMYSDTIIAEEVPLVPPNHYGIWKLAGEHLARLFHEKTGLATVCLRLNTTYGKGRDKGKTSAPTTALKTIAIGYVARNPLLYEMPYTGRENYHFVEDVGAHFASCTLLPFSGFGIFNIKGETIPVQAFLDLASKEASELGMGDYVRLRIAGDASPNLFVSDLDHKKIEAAFKDLPLTPIHKGIRQSLLAFRAMAEKGILNPSMINS